jgi:hypothetical protein
MCFRHIIGPVGARSTYGGEKRSRKSFGGETLQDIGVDGKIILKWMWELG